ncbi:class I SAM-dependent methyltransferase [Alkalilimnicola ehrlichii]|uniref:class I SAM-dependent methyltransferase n=1 Tax=Alkalilimnicola ehrlichii TaxID=351052 RepID=UPI0021628814|nr:class I SAM-dependent methyltransferase [Alkalilimnicola ehrlichii]
MRARLWLRPRVGSAAMLEEKGRSVALYDPFFAPDRAALQTQYDFLVCSEVAEHFHQPAEEFVRLNSLLKPGGVLAVMTNLLAPSIDFGGWHYRRDPTHVVFYTEPTMRWLSKRHGWRLERPHKRVTLFWKL